MKTSNSKIKTVLAGLLDKAIIVLVSFVIISGMTLHTKWTATVQERDAFAEQVINLQEQLMVSELTTVVEPPSEICFNINVKGESLKDNKGYWTKTRKWQTSCFTKEELETGFEIERMKIDIEVARALKCQAFLQQNPVAWNTIGTTTVNLKSEWNSHTGFLRQKPENYLKSWHGRGASGNNYKIYIQDVQ